MWSTNSQSRQRSPNTDQATKVMLHLVSSVPFLIPCKTQVVEGNLLKMLFWLIKLIHTENLPGLVLPVPQSPHSRAKQTH